MTHDDVPSTAVLLVAHGSRATDANDSHRALAHGLDHRVDQSVRPAFLELAEPSIPAAIDAAVADGAATVIVLPYFLHPGRHVRDDLPGIVGEAAERHPGRRIELAAAFGDDHAVLDLLVDQVHRATDAH
ncbi:MAG: CbiX/SirB N-terminal domain-containing protein [Actinobacteria bacterium]|nr:CbiX/SirB N-terminal domain-containing protein [Actinomycetota bacterium]